MIFHEPLIQAVFKKRYKRFFADVEIAGQPEVAHVPNTGSMKSCGEADTQCLVSKAKNPERKLKYTLEALRAPSGSWVGVNTQNPNALVKENWQTLWPDFSEMQAEVKINAETRLDFCLTRGDSKRFVEVKNVTLRVGSAAQFPDAITTRGQKHLQELMNLIEQGHEAEILFIVQRGDCEFFTPAAEIDPEYAKLLEQAAAKGLRITPVVVDINENALNLTNKKLEVRL